MKRMFTRIAACSLAVLIAFNTVAVPKSKAVAFGSQFASAVTAAFMTATGFSMNASGDWSGTSADMYIAERLDKFLRDFAEAREMTKAQFEELIYDGVEIVHGGLVKVSSGVATLLSGFSDWLIDKFGLIGKDGVPVTNPVVLYDGSQCLVVNGTTVSPCYDSRGELVYVFPRTDVLTSYTFSTGRKVNTQNNYNGKNYGYIQYVGLEWKDADNSAAWGFSALRDEPFIYLYTDYSTYPTYQETVYFSNTHCAITGVQLSDNSLSVSLPSDYEAPPLVSEQHAMVIDTGMTFEDEQTLIDSILAGVASGSLSPTYTIEDATDSDVVVPDEDTQAGILSWVKRIAQSIISLPQAIADKFAAFPQSIAKAIEGIFVPDVALTTEITDTFSEKFAFMPTLHKLGQDLLNMGPDPKPPVVYIHLENAEGAIRYGGTEKALDMSWYERYKPTGDAVISGFLWLGFLWLLFKRAAAIIRGAEMVSDYSNDFDVGGRSGRHR